MRLSYSTLVMLEQAGDEAAAVITRAHKNEANLIWQDERIQIGYHRHNEHFTLRAPGGREVISPTRWSRVWETRSRTPLPIERTMLQASRGGGSMLSFNPSTLDYDSSIYDHYDDT